MTDIRKLPLDPAPFLVENLGLLPKGRVLDVAMGNGRNSIFLARNGFQVEGIDISREAVGMALEHAEERGVEISAGIADLEDHFTIAAHQYDVIICFNYLHRPLIPALKKGLRREGMIIYETYIVDQTRFGKPRNPAHLLRHNELLDLFREFRCLRYHEGIFENRKALAGIIAQKTAV
jgi:2-polyprenyl-3-methyl-5-hydroxy-6-metoxy-1,4-benzoquinol methylase